MWSSAEDSEKGDAKTDNSRGGYERLGNLMGDVPSVAIFHRFARLSAQSLLHYEAELKVLSDNLQKYQQMDREAREGTARKRHDFNSRSLRESTEPKPKGDYMHKGAQNGQASDRVCEVSDEEDDPRQWETMHRARVVLDKYYAALLQHYQVASLRKPKNSQLKELRDWMERPSRGNMFLTGVDADIWKDSKLEELVSMEPPIPEGIGPSPMTEPLADLYHNMLGRFLHRSEKSDHLQNSIVYNDEGVVKVLRAIQALLACMLPIAGIVVLYFVQDMAARIGVLAGMTAVFSLTLCFCTSASVKDIFGATAAFSAVLVVFVGATLNDSASREATE